MNADIELKLLAGLPLQINESLQLKPITLKQIAKLGYSKYINYLNCLTFDVEELLNGEIPEGITTFDLTLHQFLIKNNEKVSKDILEALSFFLKKDVSVFKNAETHQVILYTNMDNLITAEDYGRIKYYLQVQHCKIKPKDTEYNIDPSNEKARLMLEKLKRLKAETNKAKSTGEPLSLSDLISILSSNSNLNIKKIFKLDMYRFQNQFNRMSMLSEYNVNIQQLLAGAKADEVGFKHYISKIK